MRYNPHAQLPISAFQSYFIVKFEGWQLGNLHFLNRKKENGFFNPLIDLPAVVSWFVPHGFFLIEQFDCFPDSILGILLFSSSLSSRLCQ